MVEIPASQRVASANRRKCLDGLPVPAACNRIIAPPRSGLSKFQHLMQRSCVVAPVTPTLPHDMRIRPRRARPIRSSQAPVSSLYSPLCVAARNLDTGTSTLIFSPWSTVDRDPATLSSSRESQPTTCRLEIARGSLPRSSPSWLPRVPHPQAKSISPLRNVGFQVKP